MRRRLSVAGLVFAWLCAQGALTESIQVFAWGRMFAGYLPTMNWQAALAETFDPAKPCELCGAVQQARSVGQAESDALTPDRDPGKLVLVLSGPDDALTPVVKPAPLVTDDRIPGEWRAAVPTPPPRVVALAFATAATG